MNKKINLVFMGGFTYPHGMAGTKRIQHAIKALRVFPGVTLRVIILRQSSRDNILSGVHEGTPYQTVMGDLLRAKVLVKLPLLYVRAIRLLRDAWLPDCRNFICHYGPVDVENLVPLYWYRRLGYRIVFDIVEDFDVATDMLHSLYYRTKIARIKWLSSLMQGLASGVVVISSRLEEKYSAFGGGRVPVHFRGISVDMDCFPVEPRPVKSLTSLFYAGSFGNRKDGLPELLDAFDILAAQRKDVRLVLTGKGDGESMEKFFKRVAASPYRDRVDYKGYLDDESYYAALNSADIPCMTRIDTGYTNAGFPFKLGEFLASGKPVIASRVSDVERFLVNRRNAMLVRPGDSEEIVKAAEYLMENPNDAAAMGMRGRETAKSSFDYRQQGKALLTFLESL